MRYALIKNAPLGSLLDRDSNMRVEWEKYGFKPEHLSRLAVQGDDDNGDFAQLLPIYDDAEFDSMLPGLQAKIEGDLFPNDSIEILTEDADVEAYKAQVLAVRAAKKAEATAPVLPTEPTE
jgi:hypothetical protein